MARYRPEQTFRPVSGDTGAAQYHSNLASRLGAFGGGMLQQHAQQRMAQGDAEGRQIDPKTYQPSDKATLYNQAFRKSADAAYFASTRNDYSARLQELALEHSSNPLQYGKAAEAYREGLMGSVPDQLKNFVGVDFDSTKNDYLGKIGEAWHKSQVAAYEVEIDSALSGIRNDAYSAIESGDDTAFLARRDVFVGKVAGSDLRPEQKAKQIQQFDIQADLHYHNGEVTRMLEGGDVEGAMSYARKLQTGAVKMFGGAEADRTQLVEAAQSAIGKYISEESTVDAFKLQQVRQSYEQNLESWAADFVIGKASAIQLDTMFVNRDIGLSEYRLGKTIAKADPVVSDPVVGLEFSMMLGDRPPAELQDFIREKVSEGSLSPGDAATMWGKTRSSDADMLGQMDVKRELSWLKTAIGMDKEIVDLTNDQAVMNAEAYRKAQDAILQGANPRDAVGGAFEWWRQTSTDSFVTDFGLIRTVDDVNKAAQALADQIVGTPTIEQARQIEKLQQIKAQMQAIEVRQ